VTSPSIPSSPIASSSSLFLTTVLSLPHLAPARDDSRPPHVSDPHWPRARGRSRGGGGARPRLPVAASGGRRAGSGGARVFSPLISNQGSLWHLPLLFPSVGCDVVASTAEVTVAAAW
jgi:hypothetical protein